MLLDKAHFMMSHFWVIHTSVRTHAALAHSVLNVTKGNQLCVIAAKIRRRPCIIHRKQQDEQSFDRVPCEDLQDATSTENLPFARILPCMITEHYTILLIFLQESF